MPATSGAITTASPLAAAVGKRIRTGTRDGSGDWRVIVGVVSNILQSDPLRQTFKPIVYVPFRQEPAPMAVYFLVRTAASPSLVMPAIRTEISGWTPTGR
jgi:hypothetical protein